MSKNMDQIVANGLLQTRNDALDVAADLCIKLGAPWCARAIRELKESLPPRPPYPWCYHPEICIKKGYCPRDPNCGE